MPKYNILVARLTYGGTERGELGTWCAAVATYAQTDDRLAEVLHVPIDQCPTPAARNHLVELALENHCDILVSVDGDTIPHLDWFAVALDIVINSPEPCVVAAPYVAGPPEEQVHVFNWLAKQNDNPAIGVRLDRLGREEAALKTGIERVMAAGTGCFMADLRVFEKLEPPYFEYEYANASHSKVLSTEDVVCLRDLAQKEVPLWVTWDHWAVHCKTKRCTKPEVVKPSEVSARVRKHLLARKAHESGAYEDAVPEDVKGWCDFADVYSDAVREAKDGAKFVEVGAWEGKSAVTMAKLIKASGKSISFLTIDHFRGSAEHRKSGYDCDNLKAKCVANLVRHGVKDFVAVYEAESAVAASQAGDSCIDFVFLDGSHDEASVRTDIAAWLPTVKPGGVLAGHDLDNPGVYATVTALLPDAEVVGKRSWRWRKPIPLPSVEMP